MTTLLNAARRFPRRLWRSAIAMARPELARAMQSFANRRLLRWVGRALSRERFPHQLPHPVAIQGTLFADDESELVSPLVRAITADGAGEEDRADISFHHDRADGGVIASSSQGRSIRVVTRALSARASNATQDAVDLRIGRPIYFPQRGRGEVTIESVIGCGDRELARLVRQARGAERVFVSGQVLTENAGISVMLLLAAAGAPIELTDPPTDGARFIGTRTFEACIAPYRLGRRERELRSVRVRRSALSEHSPYRRLEEIAQRIGGPVPPRRNISVLLASRRPSLLPGAIEQLMTQVDCEVQLLVGLHGNEHLADRTAITGRWARDLVVEEFDEALSLGAILDALARRADGALLAKWDDDDWYGRHHLADLVLAYEYSGAEVVGKAAEFVYLEGEDKTLRRLALGAESYSRTLAGGSLLTTKAWLQDLGGWPTSRRGVDRVLIEATRAAGGLTYRTHGFQYLLRRSRTPSDHTWQAPDEYFTSAASEIRTGLDLEFADIGPE